MGEIGGGWHVTIFVAELTSRKSALGHVRFPLQTLILTMLVAACRAHRALRDECGWLSTNAADPSYPERRRRFAQRRDYEVEVEGLPGHLKGGSAFS